MPPEFQINNRILGRDNLKHAEAVDSISHNQYGSWKYHKSVNICLNKKLVCDVLIQKKRAGYVEIVDTFGAYERISRSIVVLTLLSFGIPQQVCRVLFSTLQKAKHCIKPDFGRSEAVLYGNEAMSLSVIGKGKEWGQACGA